MAHDPVVEQNLERIIQSIENIGHVGASPELTLKLLDIINNTNADINEIALFLSREPAICAQLLKLANSAYFSRGTEIRTISQAIVHLGLDRVNQLIMAIEMIGMFTSKRWNYHFDDKMFLKSSIAGAMLCEKLGSRLGLNDTQGLFISGMLRNFGVLVIREYFPDLFNNIYIYTIEKRCSFSAACASVCGLEQRYIGYLLFTRWNMPSNVLAVFQKKSGKVGLSVIIDKIVEHSDTILKQRNYGQWDPHYVETATPSDMFAFDDKDFEESLQHTFSEVDEFVSAFY
jgi:HD-like signal output (HDOD) protein